MDEPHDMDIDCVVDIDDDCVGKFGNLFAERGELAQVSDGEVQGNLGDHSKCGKFTTSTRPSCTRRWTWCEDIFIQWRLVE